jgi:hypothetical protein
MGILRCKEIFLRLLYDWKFISQHFVLIPFDNSFFVCAYAYVCAAGVNVCSISSSNSDQIHSQILKVCNNNAFTSFYHSQK